jgi:hypothetical protein
MDYFTPASAESFPKCLLLLKIGKTLQPEKAIMISLVPRTTATTEEGVFPTIMTPNIRHLLSLFVLISIHSTSHADGLIVKLPKDGVEVRYKIEYEPISNPGFKFMTIRSVGKIIHIDKPCRWIEFGFLRGENVNSGDEHIKILVPETELIKGGEPLGHVIKGFLKNGNSEPRALPKVLDIKRSPLPILLAAADKNSVPLEAIQLNTGLGNLQCQGSKGTGVFISKSIEEEGGKVEENPFKITADTEYRFHDKVPFGVAQLRLAMVLDRGGDFNDKVNI